MTPRLSHRRRLLLTAAVSLGLSGTARADIAVNTVSFQDGLDGYLGTSERLISTTTASQLPSASNASPASWMVDGYNGADSPDTVGLIKFDNLIGSSAGQIPAGATILSAKLTLTTATSSNAQTGGWFNVAGLKQPFSSTTTFVDYGANGPYYDQGFATRSTGGFVDLADPRIADADSTIDQGQVVSANVAPIVQQWVNGSLTNNGLTVSAGRPASTTDGWTYGTHWNTDAAQRPKLEVSYTTDKLDTYNFQQGVNGYTAGSSAWVRQDNNNNNGNPVPVDGAQLTGSQYLDGPATGSPDDQAMVRFNNIFADEGGTLPRTAQILSAKLIITSGNATNAMSRGDYDVAKVLKEWDTDPSTTDKPTYYTEWGGGSGPSEETGDIGPIADRVSAIAKDGLNYFDVTQILKDWQNGEANYGFNIQAGNTADGWAILFSGASDASTRPLLQIITIGQNDSVWANATGGDWITASNWQSSLVPDGVNRVAIFGSALTADGSVALDTSKTLGIVRFDNAAAKYTLTGAGPLKLQNAAGNALVQVINGNHEIATPVSTLSSLDFDVAAGSTLKITGAIDAHANTVTKISAGDLAVSSIQAKTLRVQGGTLSIVAGPAGAASAVVNSLNISTGAKLDVTNQSLVVDYATGATSPLASIQTAITAGRLVGATDSTHTLLAVEASALTAANGATTFHGTTLDADMALVTLALNGDSNIDGAVNFSDLLTLAAAYGTTAGATWFTGDFNNDAAVNFSDLLTLAANYGTGTVTGSFAGDWALAQSVVPEPGALLGLASLAIPLAHRRRA
ncbi:MAG: DNRLRE domain-containing protein [Tepidisphaeraceae bacterium]